MSSIEGTEAYFHEVQKTKHPLLSLPSTGSGQVPGDDASAFEREMDAQDVPKGVRLKESARFILDPSLGNFGCAVPAGVWHTVEVLEPSIIYEAKDGKYGEDGSESWTDPLLSPSKGDDKMSTNNDFSNSLGDLKKNIEYLIGMERVEGTLSP